MSNGGGPFGIGNQILQGFFGNETLRDYTHASRVFTTNNYELKPRFKFQFHVSFTLNTDQIPYLKNVFPDTKVLSLLVKTVDLPKYNIDVESLNQYNRKRLVQTKINYQPVNITFHDDAGDNARRLWYYYFSYYYKDPTQQYLSSPVTNGPSALSNNAVKGFGYNARDIYDKEMQVKDWGYVGESWSDGGTTVNSINNSGKPPFFRDIRIYGIDRNGGGAGKNFAEYILINPLITSWNHDTYNYSEGSGTMQHTMTVAYETVKYYDGAVGRSRPDVNVQGFADPAHYDTRPSPIAKPGATTSVFGQGGLLDAGAGILGDLQSGTLAGLIGAAQTAGRTYNTFKGKNLASIAKSESVAIGTKVINQGIASQQVKSFINKPLTSYIPTPEK